MQLVTLPRVQTDDKNINQLQNNISNALQATVAGKLNVVGQVVTASLTESQFQAQSGKEWILCDGRSVVGSKYNHITGYLTAPTIAPSGTINSFIRID